jgi:uncharacterized protein (DUF1778 family)
MGDDKEDDNKCSCDDHVYTIHPDAVDGFYAALDKPDEPTEALKELFEKKTIFKD